MQLPALLVLCGLALSLLLTPLLRDLAVRRQWLDKPDAQRKRHAKPLPRIGGVPVVLAYAGCFGIVLLLEPLTGTSAFALEHFWKFFPAAAIVFAIGLVDDFVSLTPWQKLFGESVAAVIACLSGVQIHNVAGFAIDPIVGVPLTIMWLVACANAFNLIDGMDGLASGLGLLASATMLLAAFLRGDTGLILATAPLVGVLLGFLVFNFNPASIFLGDCGSLWVGFMLACYGVVWSQKAATVLGVSAPLIALAVPLLDTMLAIVRRYLRNQPVFSADHDHIHHRLLSRGFSPRQVVIVLYAAGGLAACFSLLQSRTGAAGGVLVAFGFAVWVGIQYLRYQEFGIAAGWFRRNGLRSTVRSQVCMEKCEESLRAASTPDECWKIVRTLGSEFGFSQVALRLGGKRFHEFLDETGNRHWMLHIPLSESEYVRFMCPFELANAPILIGPLASFLHRNLSKKTAELPEPAVDLVSWERAVAASAGTRIQ